MDKGDLLAVFQQQLNSLVDWQSPNTNDDIVNFRIALSGGLDSVVLTHLFSRLQASRLQVKDYKIKVSAQHVNHGLSDNAQSWQTFCEHLCQTLNIDFSLSCVQLNRKSRTSLEALAREKRYACLTQGLNEHSYLITGHHQDDQLETVLLALKRGSGITGLQGVRHTQKLKSGYLIRPLLGFTRQELETYGKLFKLDWIEDESNNDQVFDRNFLRHSITPLLKNRWPSIAKSVARTATICQEQQQVLDEIAQLDFDQAVDFFINQQALNIEILAALSVGRRNNVLRHWFKLNQLEYPSAKQLQTLWTDVAMASADAKPVVLFKGASVRRYRQHIYLIDETSPLADKNKANLQPVIWSGESQLCLFDGHVNLQFKQVAATESDETGIFIDPNDLVEVFFRWQFPNSLKCLPIGRTGSRSIKKLLHEYHVPLWLRDQVPFIFINGELKMAVGLWSCNNGKDKQQSSCLMIDFTK
ncbi:MAG: tRNA lysidine(34) synthetase TilS [Psychromonas sp.]